MAKKDSKSPASSPSPFAFFLSPFLAAGLVFSADAASKKAPESISEADKIWVKKHDGGISCESKETAQSIEAGRKSLEDAQVKVFESRKQHDNKMRASVCGIPTGSENAYQIPASDLERAKKLGYRLDPGGNNPLESSAPQKR